LTAAHCTEELPFDYFLNHVRLGEWDTTKNLDCESDGEDCNEPHQDIIISGKIAHPKYVGKPQNHFDIALLRLARKATLSKVLKPICLPVDETLYPQDLAGTQVTAAGWGTTENHVYSPKKMKVNLMVYENRNCSLSYAKYNRTITSNQICSGGINAEDTW